MRLWHILLIPFLPDAATSGDRKKNQLLGQHRECCALRGLGWGKKHSTVDYVFKYPLSKLAAYHHVVIDELEKRQYNINPKWKWFSYRGSKADVDTGVLIGNPDIDPHYPEHNDDYLDECLSNLARKGIIIERSRLWIRGSGLTRSCRE